jgi:hypothetical protein
LRPVVDHILQEFNTLYLTRFRTYNIATMVRRGSVWCGVAQYGAAWLSMVRRGSVGSASACCKAGPSSILGSAPQGGSPTEQTSDEEMERDLSEWRRMNVIV